jgi:hypothetical protein
MIRTSVTMALLGALLMAATGCCTKQVIANIQENDFRNCDRFCGLARPDLACVGCDGSIAIRTRLEDPIDPDGPRNGKVRYLIFDRATVVLAAGERHPALFLNCPNSKTFPDRIVPGDLTAPDATEDLLPEPLRQGTRYPLTVEPGRLEGWLESDSVHPSWFPYTVDDRTYQVYAGRGMPWRYFIGGTAVRPGLSAMCSCCRWR